MYSNKAHANQNTPLKLYRRPASKKKRTSETIKEKEKVTFEKKIIINSLDAKHGMTTSHYPNSSKMQLLRENITCVLPC